MARDRRVKPENLKVDEKQHAHLKKYGAQKGQPSRNPKGRPAIPQEIKDALAEHSLEAVAIRLWLMRHSKDERVRLKAAEGFTKPFVAEAPREDKLDVNLTVTNTDMFLAEMAARHNIIEGKTVKPLVIDAELVDDNAE